MVSFPKTSPIIVAHRGLYYEKPENTGEGLRAALTKGFDVETDVQLLSSGELILFHDDFISSEKDAKVGRTSGGFYLPQTRRVNDCTIGDIRSAVFNQTKLEQILTQQAGEQIKLNIDEAPKIATLDDLLPIPDGRKVYLEIKRFQDEDKPFSDQVVNKVLDWIKANDVEDKVVIISFNQYDLLKTRSLNKDIAIGADVYDSMGPTDLHRTNTSSNLERAKELRNKIRFTSWHPPLQDINKELVDNLHALGYVIAPWTWGENKAGELTRINEVAALGADGFITNQAREVREMLSSH